MDLQTAFSKWEELLGSQFVIRSDDDIERASSTTFPTDQRILGIVQPSTTAEVQECVRIAKASRVPIYPVSRGRNYGYGARVPAHGGAVVFELKRMNRIVDFDEELAYVRVEPGVTFRQVYEYLQQHDSSLMLPVLTGGPVDGSLIGNRLERGQGESVVDVMVPPACDWEVVLPTGERIHTGVGRYEAKGSSVYPFSPGPDATGLFEQSGLGIVTKMTIWLARQPNDVRDVFFSVETEEQLRATIAVLRELLLDGVLHTTGFTNDYRTAGMSLDYRYPWEESGGQTPLPTSFLEGIPKWVGATALVSPSAAVGRARQKLVKKRLKPVVDRLLIKTPLVQTSARLVEPITPKVFGLSNILKLLSFPLSRRGEPDASAMNMAYWRKRGDIPQDFELDRDRCGLLWFAPIVPNRADDLLHVNKLARDIFLSHGFEPFVRFLNWGPRAYMFVMTLVYDRDVPGEDDRAKVCYRELFEKVTQRDGYIPYRVSISAMDLMPQPRDEWLSFMKRLKESLDPADIQSRGRYDWRHHWQGT